MKKVMRKAVRVVSEGKALRIDMHVHTPGSDGHGTPEAYVLAAKAAGLDGIAITDHHHTCNHENDLIAAAFQNEGMLVIRGCEYSTANGHLLIFGVDVDKLGLGFYPPMQTVIIKVVAAGGVCVPSHPYYGYAKGMLGDKLYKLTGVPACEGFNGRLEAEMPIKNGHARKAAAKMGIATTGGSDAHWAEDVGLAYTEFPEDVKDEKGVLEALKTGRCKGCVNEVKMNRKVERLLRAYTAKDAGEVVYGASPKRYSGAGEDIE